MSSRSCLLLAMLVALLVPGESYGDELEGPIQGPLFAKVEFAGPYPAAPALRVGVATGCIETSVPAGLGVSPSWGSEALCFPGMNFLLEAVERYRRDVVAERERRRLKRERERRERIAKRRAERRARLMNCARYVAERYAAPGEADRLLEAPLVVQEVICAANEIDDASYFYGGGHGEFTPGGESSYDCSGAVSYALNGGDLIDAPLNSVGLEGWGESGPGKWITVYANAGHAWMEVAGVRFDTREPPEGETGPRWHSTTSSPEGFIARHPLNY